jgi:multiple sugar transport system substrate-binding protein
MGAESDQTKWSERRVSRRSILRYSFLSAAAMTVVAACQSAATPAPTSAPAAAPTTAPAAKPTSAPAAQAPAFNKAKINGKLTVVQARDFHPDHNAYIQSKIQEFAQQMDYPLDHSYIEAYAGAGDVVQKLTAAVLAGDAPDLFIHNSVQTTQLHFLDIVEDVDALEKDIEKDHGQAHAGYQKASLIDGKWWAIPHFSRASGYWVRQGALKAAGIDPQKDLGDFDKFRDAAMKISKPDQEFWGWGMTANRSGDGDATVRNPIYTFGGQLADETGQIVVLNTEPYRTNAIAGLNWLKDVFLDAKYASMLPPGIGGWTDTGNNDAWLAGKIGLTNNAGTLFATAVVNKNPVADDSYMILSPKGLGPNARELMGPGDAMNLYIMKGAKNREATEQLIRYLTQPDVYKQMFKISTGYVYPARQWGWDQPEITESDYAKHVTDVWKTISTHPSAYLGTSYPGSPQPHLNALDTTNFWTDMFGEILAGRSVEDTLKSAHDKAVKTFKDFGAKGE